MTAPRHANPQARRLREQAVAIARACYGHLDDLQPLASRSNAVFCLAVDDRRKVLKMATRPGHRLHREVVAARLLRQHDLPAPEIEHQDVAGETMGRPFIIMRSAGRNTVAVSWDWLTHEQQWALMHEMGRILARIHEIVVDPPDGAAAPLEPPCREELWLDRAGILDRAEATGLFPLDDMARLRALVYRSPCPNGRSLVHRDYHARQCIIRGDRIVAVVDWEGAGVGDPAADYARHHVYMDTWYPPHLTDAFCQGYACVRPLPDDYVISSLPVRTLQLLRHIRPDEGDPTLRRKLALFRRLVDLCGSAG